MFHIRCLYSTQPPCLQRILTIPELWKFRSHVLSLTYFRSQERKYHRWNCRSLELLFPGAPCNNMYCPLNFRPVPMQLKKRITVAASAKECSSLPTNVALQSVLASRHVRLTHDVVWHGISKDYEVVTERIDKLRLQLTRTSDRLYYVLIYTGRYPALKQQRTGHVQTRDRPTNAVVLLTKNTVDNLRRCVLASFDYDGFDFCSGQFHATDATASNV